MVAIGHLQSDHFTKDRLYPSLDERILARYTIDYHGGLFGSQIGLMEHEGIVVEAEQVAGIRILLQSKERGEIAGSGRGGNPFCDCASRSVTL